MSGAAFDDVPLLPAFQRSAVEVVAGDADRRGATVEDTARRLTSSAPITESDDAE